MCPRLGIDASLRLLLDAVVTHRRRGGKTILDVLARDLHDQTGTHRVRHPDARIAVRLQLHANRVRLRACVTALRPAQDSGQILDVVPVLVSENVRLGERPSRGAEARLQLLEEAEVDVHIAVSRAVERPDCGARLAAAGRYSAGEERRARGLVTTERVDQCFWTLFTTARMRQS